MVPAARDQVLIMASEPRPSLHFLGFRDDRWWNAVRVFDGPTSSTRNGICALGGKLQMGISWFSQPGMRRSQLRATTLRISLKVVMAGRK